MVHANPQSRYVQGQADGGTIAPEHYQCRWGKEACLVCGIHMSHEKTQRTMIYLDNQSVNVIGDGIRKGLKNGEKKLHITQVQLKMSVAQSNNMLRR